MQLTDEAVESFKEICKKEGITYDSEDKYREAAHNLYGLYEMLFELAVKEAKRKKRLEKEPKGFPLPGEGHTCPLCDNCIFDEDIWYDKWGMKCLSCQDALNKKIIPGYVFRDHDNKKHITANELAYKYHLHYQTVRKIIRQNQLKIRVIPKSGTIVLLRKENPGLPDILEKEIAKIGLK